MEMRSREALPPLAHTQGSTKRISNACQRCRRRKIKCSGSDPCSNCSRREFECKYEFDRGRVMVSRRYLRHLEHLSSPSRRRDETSLHHLDDMDLSHDRVIRSPPEDEPVPFQPRVIPNSAELQTTPSCETSQISTGNSTAWVDSNISNPLASTTSAYLADSRHRFRSLGESSTWSFTHRTLVFLRDYLNHPDYPKLDLNEEGSAYPVNLFSRVHDTPTVGNLPSIDYAIFLTNSVKFHIGQLFHIFDEAQFMHKLHEFYEGPLQVAETNKLWYVQFQVILALGKAVTVQMREGSLAPPGSDLFARAMAIMPDPVFMFKDALTAIELLCAVALYLQLTDMRNSAYVYIGQAMRMALVYALHRERPPNDWGAQTAGRCRNIWWTVYILDRTFSSSMGTPVSINDDDITTSLPLVQSSNKSTTLNIYVKLSRAVGGVLKQVYGPNGRLNTSFLLSTRNVLRNIAVVGEELDQYYKLSFDGSIGGISRVSAHLNLSYHQAILLALYPLLLGYFQKQIRLGSGSSGQAPEFSETTIALLKTCADSSSKILRILGALRQSNLLESTFPFDRDATFAASFVQTMISVIAPRVIKNPTHRSETYLILDEMIHCGSVPASFRKSELQILERMIEIWRHQSDTEIDDNAKGFEDPNHASQAEDFVSMPGATVVEMQAGNFEMVTEFGDATTLCPENLVSLADLIDVGEGLGFQEAGWLDELVGQGTPAAPSESILGI